jgi:signal transduction histidine kinase
MQQFLTVSVSYLISFSYLNFEHSSLYYFSREHTILMLHESALSVIELFQQVSLFRELLTEEQLQLFQLGFHKCLNIGEMVFYQGDPADYFYVVLEGEIRISRKVDNRELIVATYGSDFFFGEVPLLAGTPHLASGKAVSKTCLYCFQKDDFWQILINYPSIRKKILGLMASRMQELLMLSQHSEKLIALGTLAAGLAHELNNPASAACRAVEQLGDTMQNRHIISFQHIEQCLTPTQLKFILKIKLDAIEYATTSNRFEPLLQIDLEDKLINWLDNHGISDGWKFTPTLIAAGITVEQLEILTEQMTVDTISNILIWLEVTLAEASLLNVLRHSTIRVSELVKAVKAYSYMDQALIQHRCLNVCDGLESTLTILNHKLRKHGVTIIRDYAQNLSSIQADGSALNQVWTNLIDNAIDALGEQGTIWVRTSVDKDYVVVEIADNGLGIPVEIQPRIFEAFFTTKEIGKGTGIGLNLAYRIIVIEHHGSIDCYSRPGYTSFLVRLPIQNIN